VLLILDFVNNTFNINNMKCVNTYYYDINDKMNDLLSYILVYLFFPLNNIFLIFLIYRAIGVLLFTLTKNHIWLIIMPDLVKEYLIYVYLFKSNNTYLPILILGKVLFEWGKQKFTTYYLR